MMNMALQKTNYIDDQTVISAKNLNDIQDSVIGLESRKVNGKTLSADISLLASDVGAAPAGLVSDYLYCATADALETFVTTTYSGMADRTKKVAIVNTGYASDTVPGSGSWFLEFRRYDANSGTIKAIKYGTPCAKEMVRSIQTGTWNAWVDCSSTAFAPAGYGLGVPSLDTPFIDTPAKMDALSVNRWFIFTGGAANPLTIDGENITYGWGRVDTYNSNNVKMTFWVYAPSHLKTANAEYCRFKVEGVWGEWKKCGVKDFAPAGYGYGGEVLATGTTGTTTEAELEVVLRSLLSGMNNNEAKQIRFACSALGDWTFCGTLMKTGKSYGALTAFAEYKDGVIKIAKAYYNGAWYPLEWVNPPMSVGVEYRTTERWNGKAVYVKAVNFGSLTLANASVSHGIANIQNVVSKSLLGQYGSELSTSERVKHFNVSTTTIEIDVDADLNQTATVHMKYTKTTD